MSDAVGPHVHIPVRVSIEDENLDRCTSVARVLSRVGTDDEPTRSEAQDALRAFLKMTEVDGTPVADHLQGFGVDRTITD